MIKYFCDICGAESKEGVSLRETRLPIGKTMIDGVELIKYDTVNHVCASCNTAIINAICDQIEKLRGTGEGKKVEAAPTVWGNSELRILPGRLSTILAVRGINSWEDLIQTLVGEGLVARGIGYKLLEELEMYTGHKLEKKDGRIYIADIDAEETNEI